MTDFAAFIMNPGNLIFGFVAILAFFSLLTLGQSLTSGEQLEKRMKSVATRREELRRLSRQTIKEGSSLRHTDTSPYRALVEKLNLKTLLEDPKVVDNLAMAGFRGPKPISTFYFFRFAMPFVLGAIAAFEMFVVDIGHYPVQVKLLITVGAFVVGYYAPNLYISNRATKRRTSIMQAFPDSL
ncbi:MAG TPA: type II secretion system F family protein, partial [Asticcacaulis sp.]|nr:type II secretion system F family protein [Asticcacaulis sp.]